MANINDLFALPCIVPEFPNILVAVFTATATPQVANDFSAGACNSQQSVLCCVHNLKHRPIHIGRLD